MTDDEYLAEFSTMLGDILGDDTIALTMDTRRKDVPGWDSFNYINFIVALEVQHGVKFRVSDVESFGTVGDIVNDLRSMIED